MMPDRHNYVFTNGKILYTGNACLCLYDTMKNSEPLSASNSAIRFSGAPSFPAHSVKGNFDSAIRIAIETLPGENTPGPMVR